MALPELPRASSEDKTNDPDEPLSVVIAFTDEAI